MYHISMNFSEIASEIQHVGVIDEASCMTYLELAMWISLMERIMDNQNHVPLFLDALPFHAKPALLTSDRRSPGTTSVRCSGGMQQLQQLHKRKSECQQQRAMAGRMVTDMERKGTVRDAEEEFHLCMTLCENDVRPSTTCVRCSSGSSQPLQATPAMQARHFHAKL